MCGRLKFLSIFHDDHDSEGHARRKLDQEKRFENSARAFGSSILAELPVEILPAKPVRGYAILDCE
jgi:hypothetical protein